MPRQQVPTLTSHPAPASHRFSRIGWFTKDLALKHENGIAAQNGAGSSIYNRVKCLMHRRGLGLRQPLHQQRRGWGGNGPFIHATHPNSMGDSGLLQQTTTGR